jgi:hypothetical protein
MGANLVDIFVTTAPAPLVLPIVSYQFHPLQSLHEYRFNDLQALQVQALSRVSGYR